MYKLTVLYPLPADTAAFDAHYSAVHLPLVHELPGLLRVEVAHVVATPDGSTPPYYLMTELYFADIESLQAGMGGPQGQAAAADMSNFSSGATMLVCAVTS
ncbi:EthD family reductase (plasmid) [Deinococcus sp. KNUC1210]|uniref:EthD family reductase n=1 Tax=Deinococcus sp. KNUC1210 TaxID=2917691 RepID=UPI001EF126D8|nr:EthD family reductase [Deinococcus sp. KNUC1210]ULH14110.1 EthD family reductase [Deinococcus sp. KNUC1210]